MSDFNSSRDQFDQLLDRPTVRVMRKWARQVVGRKGVSKRLRFLPLRSRTVLAMRLDLGMPASEIAYVFHVTPERIRQIEYKALRATWKRTALAQYPQAGPIL